MRQVSGGTFHKIEKNKPAVILDLQSKDKGSSTNERYAGFAERMAEEGKKISKIITTSVEVHTIDNGRDAFDRIEKKTRKIDSVFSVAGDYAAIGFMLEAMAHGYRVPSDFALLGFDDVEMASAVSPALSTIKQPITEMGAEAVRIMDNLFSNKTSEKIHRVLKSSLVTRETTP